MLVSIAIGSASPSPSVWPTIFTGLTVALGGGIVLFLLNWLRDHLTARWKRQSEAEVLAFSLVTELDQLISNCSDVVHDPLTEDHETGIYEPTVAVPVVSFSDNVHWSAFEKRLQYRIRALPNKIDAAVKSCDHIADYGEGPPFYNDYFEERELRFAWIGLEACLLTQELSERYGVELLDRGSWTPEEDFKSRIAKISRQRERDQADWQPLGFGILAASFEELEERRAGLADALATALAKRNIGGKAQ